MKLDDVEQRHRFVDDLIKKAFELEESFIHDEEFGDDWGGAMSTVENLIALAEMIRTEQIFQSTFAEMESVRSRNLDEKETYLSMVDDALTFFIDTLLLSRIEFAIDQLSDWDFKSERGKKFQKTFCKKLDTLIKKYQDIYDL